MPSKVKDPTDPVQILQALHALDLNMRSVLERLTALEDRMTNVEDTTGALRNDLSATDRAVRDFASGVLNVLSASQKGLTDTLGRQQDEHGTTVKNDSKIRLILIVGVVIAGLSLALERLGYDLKADMHGIQLKQHEEKNEARNQTKTEGPPS
jgi:hypothetical protein